MTQRADKHLEDTLAALQGDLESIDTATAIDMLERWQAILLDADFDGSDDLSSLLVQLQSQLETEDVDGAAVGELLTSLAGLTQDAADAADEDNAGKVQLLADLLGDAGDRLVG